MGAVICGFGQTSHKRLPKQDSDDRSFGITASIMEFMRPRCIRRGKKKKILMQLHHQEEKKQQLLENMSQLTLEEWLLASPCLNKGCTTNGGDFYVLKQSSKRVYSSLYREQEEDLMISSRTRESFSMEDSSLCRGQSGKTKKKVSFRLPEVADIIIFDAT